MKEKVEAIVKKVLGHEGRMISGSKSIYRYDNPSNLIVFNANLVTSRDGKIWHGDLDITVDYKLLTKIAKTIQSDIYVLHESDARFEHEKDPRLERAVVIVTAQGKIDIRPGSSYYYLDGETPKMYTDEEYLTMNPPEPRELHKYAPEDFLPCRLPVLKEFKITKANHALQALQDWFRAQYGDKAASIYRKLYVTKGYHDELEALMTKYVKKYHKGLHPVKIEQAVTWAMFDMSPCTFIDEQDWTKDQTGYIAKDNKND